MRMWQHNTSSFLLHIQYKTSNHLPLQAAFPAAPDKLETATWIVGKFWENKKSPPCFQDGDSLSKKTAASYSPALHCSTIGAGGLNFSVRNGKRWDPAAITT